MSEDLTLVPPARLGALLTEQRTLQGITIDELRERSGLALSADELRRIEQGQLSLSDDQIHRLMVAYDAGSGPLVPERSELIVDLHHGAVFAGPNTKVLPVEASVDDVLGRYLSLLYLMRDMEPGGKLVLRGEDMDVLSRALERSVVEVEHRLFELMVPGDVGGWFHRVRHRLTVPAAGILVGLTTVGSLVLVQFPAGQRPSVGAVETDTVAAETLPSSPQTESAAAAPEVVVIDVNDAELAPAVAVVRVNDGADITFEPGDPRSTGVAAESIISYPYRSHLPGWQIEYAGPRDGYRGNTNTVTRTITIYVGTNDTPISVAGVLAHEIGHALDVMYLDESARSTWLDARGIDAGWWPDSGANDFQVGAGDFAEGVAALIAESPSDSESGAFSAADLAMVQEMMP